MLSLVRYYDQQLTEAQLATCSDQEFGWNPLLNKAISSESLTARAIREVFRQRQAGQSIVRLPFQLAQRQLCNPANGHPLRPLPGAPPGWVVLECGGGGDCLFHSVGFALRQSFQEIRQAAASVIDATNVDRLLRYYHDVYREGQWSRPALLQLPDVADRVRGLQNVVSTAGGLYLGDDTTLRLLVNHADLRVGFVVFDHRGQLHRQVFANQTTERLITLLYVPGHWQLVAHQMEQDPFHRIQTTFEPFAPPEFLRQKLAEIDVNMGAHFSQWAPRLELEQVSTEHTSNSSTTN